MVQEENLIFPQTVPIDSIYRMLQKESFHFLSSANVVSPGPTSRNSVFLSVFHSVSNFLGASLVMDLASGIPLILDIEPSNLRDRLSHATLRFFSLAEPCHTQIF